MWPMWMLTEENVSYIVMMSCCHGVILFSKTYLYILRHAQDGTSDTANILAASSEVFRCNHVKTVAIGILAIV